MRRPKLRTMDLELDIVVAAPGRRVTDPEEALAILRSLQDGTLAVVSTHRRNGRHFVVARGVPAQQVDLRDLSKRERQVAAGVALGQSNKEIAQALDISEKTVRNHASNIYKKLHIFDRTQAVIYAIRKGLVNLEDLEPL